VTIGECKAMGIGSLPYDDPQAAWSDILQYFPEIPFWPQLPKRSYLENMYLQFSEHLPGRQVDLENERFFIDKTGDLQSEIEAFYNEYLSEDISRFKVSRDYCEGIYSGLDILESDPTFFAGIEYIKGQITGPVSFGLQIIDENQKSIYYNEQLHDILLKNIERKAQWQENELQRICKNSIISVDEPYLSSIGSGVINLNRNQVISDMDTIFKSIQGLTATHCCGNTDWSLLMATSVDILLFDAFNYSANLALFSNDLEKFLARGGLIGWGIVPSTSQELNEVDKKTLIDRLEDGLQLLVNKGLDKDVLLRRSLITPSCGLGPLSFDESKVAMGLTKAISDHMRQIYM
jgi:hypothetical protein